MSVSFWSVDSIFEFVKKGKSVVSAVLNWWRG